MIQRFALFSTLLHAATAAVLAAAWQQPLAIPAPDLHVALADKAFPPTGATGSGGAAKPVPAEKAGAGLHARSESPLQAPDTALTSPPRQLLQPEHPETENDQELVNHLLTELRGALDARFVYPPLARRHGWQGQVRVGLTVEATGRLSELRILSSSGYAVLDRDALQTLTQIGAIPQVRARLDGQPCRLVLPVVYRLLES